MTLTGAPEGARLTTRLDAARTRSAALRADAQRLVQEARSQVLVDPEGFVVRGTVDGRPSVVQWRRGRLLADPEVLDRLHLVVQLAQPDDTAPVPALDGSRTQLLLAVLRSLDRVGSVLLSAPDEAQAAGGRAAG